MKVTALLPDDLIQEVRMLSKGRNITESLVIALREWTAKKNLMALTQKIEREPLTFRRAFKASKIRRLNRRS